MCIKLFQAISLSLSSLLFTFPHGLLTPRRGLSYSSMLAIDNKMLLKSFKDISDNKSYRSKEYIENTVWTKLEVTSCEFRPFFTLAMGKL